MEREKSIIAYGFSKEEKYLIEMLKTRHKAKKCIYLTDSLMDSTLNGILNDAFIESDGLKLPKEKILLFDQFSDQEFLVIADIIKNTIKGSPIVETVKSIYINWSFRDLMRHLIQEREEFKLRKMMRNL